MHVHSCCFANKTYFFCFLTFSLPSASLGLKVLIMPKRHGSGNAVGESVLTKTVVFFFEKICALFNDLNSANLEKEDEEL